jgi:type II secretory pathway component PulC
MPALERAGLRPGDVVVGVNCSGFDEERMLELAWQIANSTRTEFEVERGGRRTRLAIEN